MERISKLDLAVLMAMLGITAGGSNCMAKADPITTGNDSPYYVAEKEGAKKGADAACGKGSCGADAKGAKAAKEKHAAKKSEDKTKKAADSKKEVEKKSSAN